MKLALFLAVRPPCSEMIPHAAPAQRGQQIFDLFLQGAQQELQRQQQREFEQQQLNRLQQEFAAHWHACHRGEFVACDLALGYCFVNAKDRQALLRRRPSPWPSISHACVMPRTGHPRCALRFGSPAGAESVTSARLALGVL